MTCDKCNGRRVAAICWQDLDGSNYWAVFIRCGDCETTKWIILDQEEADRWDEQLDREQEAIRNWARDMEVEDVITVDKVLGL